MRAAPTPDHGSLISGVDGAVLRGLGGRRKAHLVRPPATRSRNGVTDEAIPSCSTGPLALVRWTARELWDLVVRRGERTT